MKCFSFSSHVPLRCEYSNPNDFVTPEMTTNHSCFSLFESPSFTEGGKGGKYFSAFVNKEKRQNEGPCKKVSLICYTLTTHGANRQAQRVSVSAHSPER